MKTCKDCLYHLEIEDEYICVNELSENYNECTSDNDSCPGFFFYEGRKNFSCFNEKLTGNSVDGEAEEAQPR